MTPFDRGDVVMVDFGIAGKVRPCVVISYPGADSQRNMSIVAPLTTQARGGVSEIAFPKPAWLRQESVVNLLGLFGVDDAKVIRRLAPFPKDSFDRLLEVLAELLGLTASRSREPVPPPSEGR